MYSDTLFRLWLCRSFAVDPSLFLTAQNNAYPNTQKIRAEEASSLTIHRFLVEWIAVRK